MIPAMKAAIAHFSGDAQWAEVRPPLVKLDAAKTADLIAAMKAANFEITGL